MSLIISPGNLAYWPFRCGYVPFQMAHSPDTPSAMACSAIARPPWLACRGCLCLGACGFLLSFAFLHYGFELWLHCVFGEYSAGSLPVPVHLLLVWNSLGICLWIAVPLPSSPALTFLGCQLQPWISVVVIPCLCGYYFPLVNSKETQSPCSVNFLLQVFAPPVFVSKLFTLSAIPTFPDWLSCLLLGLLKTTTYFSFSENQI